MECLACMTTNGIGSTIFWRDERGALAARHRITRLYVEAVLYRLRTSRHGAMDQYAWRHLPARFGYWKSMPQCFSRC
jgi:hypothetical protein